MRRLTQYDGSGKAESYVGEFDEINIYRGGMEGDYISGYQITRLAQYEDLGTIEELKEISEIKNQVIDQNSLDKSLKEIRSLDKDILLERCENQQIELYKLYKMLGYAKQIASRPADIVWGEILMDYLDKHNAIIPKFKLGQRVFYRTAHNVFNGIVTKTKVTNSKKVQYSIKGDDNQLHIKNEKDVFATEHEAEKRRTQIINELKGGV